MTVPTEFPQVFDSEFVEDDRWMPALPPEKLFYDKESYEALVARYGPNWGLQQIGKPIPKPWKPLTHDELRSRYPQKTVA